jgi:hypothetical protein
VKTDECTRHITLTVIEDTLSSVDHITEEQQPQLILENGLIYILQKDKRYTLLGETLQ